MDVSVLRWKGASDFNWLFLVNPVQQLTFIPADGNIRCFETYCFVQNTKTMDRVQKLITVKPWFCDPTFCITQFYVLLCGLGQVHIRTNIPRFYSILCGPHKNVKLEFYCNFNCGPCSSVQPALLPLTFIYSLTLLVVYSHPECINCNGVYYCVWTTFT